MAWLLDPCRCSWCWPAATQGTRARFGRDVSLPAYRTPGTEAPELPQEITIAGQAGEIVLDVGPTLEPLTYAWQSDGVCRIPDPTY